MWGTGIFRWRWLLPNCSHRPKIETQGNQNGYIFYNVKHLFSTRQFSDLESSLYILYCTDKLHTYIVNDWKLFSLISKIMLCNIVFTIYFRLFLCLLIDLSLIIGVNYSNLLKVPFTNNILRTFMTDTNNRNSG